MAKAAKRRTVTIRADNGHFATTKYAAKHPDKVEKVTVHPKKKK
jgi:hypothetical protein